MNLFFLKNISINTCYNYLLSAAKQLGVQFSEHWCSGVAQPGVLSATLAFYFFASPVGINEDLSTAVGGELWPLTVKHFHLKPLFIDERILAGSKTAPIFRIDKQESSYVPIIWLSFPNILRYRTTMRQVCEESWRLRNSKICFIMRWKKAVVA